MPHKLTIVNPFGGGKKIKNRRKKIYHKLKIQERKLKDITRCLKKYFTTTLQGQSRCTCGQWSEYFYTYTCNDEKVKVEGSESKEKKYVREFRHSSMLVHQR